MLKYSIHKCDVCINEGIQRLLHLPPIDNLTMGTSQGDGCLKKMIKRMLHPYQNGPLPRLEENRKNNHARFRGHNCYKIPKAP